MLQPTDNSFPTVFNRIFFKERAGELLKIERALQAAPDCYSVWQIKNQMLMHLLIDLDSEASRIQKEQRAALPSPTLPAVQAKPEPRLDSRIIAEHLGVEHRAVLALITRYQPELETFGLLAFEMRVRDRGIPTRFAFLNENQCYFLATLSRNTCQVVTFKMWLVKTFSDYRTGVSLDLPSMI